MESGGSQAVREEGSLGSSAAAAGGQGQGQGSQAPLGNCTHCTSLGWSRYYLDYSLLTVRYLRNIGKNISFQFDQKYCFSIQSQIFMKIILMEKMTFLYCFRIVND